MRPLAWQRNGLRGHGKLSHLARRHRFFRYGCALFLAMLVIFFLSSLVFMQDSRATQKGPRWRTWSDIPLAWYKDGKPPEVVTLAPHYMPSLHPPHVNNTTTTQTTSNNCSTDSVNTKAGLNQSSVSPIVRYVAQGQILVRLQPRLTITPDLDDTEDYIVDKKKGNDDVDRENLAGERHRTKVEGDEEGFGNDPLPPSPDALTKSTFLRELRVQMLRTRRTRHTWATRGVEPIVGLVPSEDASLFFPHEVLVEEYGNDEDGKRRVQDAKMYMPMDVTSNNDDEEDEKEDGGGLLSITLRAHTEEEDSHAVTPYHTHVHICSRAAGNARQDGKGESEQEEPSVEMCRLMFNKILDGANSDTYLVWRSGARQSAVTIQLALPSPKQGDAYDERDKALDDIEDIDVMNETQANKKVAATSTQALAACITFTHVRRLYGLPGLLHDDGASLELPRHNFSRLVLIGGHDTHSGSTVMSHGVIPLLFIETEEEGNDENTRMPLRVTRGIFWLHGGPFYLNITTTDVIHDRTRLCLRSTAGATRLYLLPGPSEQLVRMQYFTLTGFPLLPPRIVLGYHSGTRDETTSADTLRHSSVQHAAQHLPLTALWLSNPSLLTKGTPFTWNRTRIASPVALQRDLWRLSRSVLLFPAIPSVAMLSYSPLYQEAVRHALFVNERPTQLMPWFHWSAEGMLSHLIDFVSPEARVWYAGLLKYKRFAGSTNYTFLRLRHAGPFISNGDTSTTTTTLYTSFTKTADASATSTDMSSNNNIDMLQKLRLPMQLGHYGGVSQHQVHHVWPLYYAMAAQYGLVRRTQFHRRGLVIADEFFAGSQRVAVIALSQPTAAYTTKDTGVTQLQRLRSALRRCLSLNVMGLPYVGFNLADGFADNTVKVNHDNKVLGEGQLQQYEDDAGRLRWFQAAMLMPLMYTEKSASTSFTSATKKGSHSEYERMTNWLLSSPSAAAQTARQVIRLRYAFLPSLYTALWRTSEEGEPFLSASNSEALNHTRTSQSSPVLCFYVGKDFLSCPLVQPTPLPTNKSRTSFTLPTSSPHIHTYFAPASMEPNTNTTDRAIFVDYWSGMRYAGGERVYLETDQYSIQEGSRALISLPFWLQQRNNDDNKSQGHAVRARQGNIEDKALVSMHSITAPLFVRVGAVVVHSFYCPEPTTHDNNKDAQEDIKLSEVATPGVQRAMNFSLVLTLPAFTTADTITATQQTPFVLVRGWMYWDEGSLNDQVQPSKSWLARKGMRTTTPPPYMKHAKEGEAPHCKVALQAALVAKNTLTVTGTQRSASCVHVVRALHDLWRQGDDPILAGGIDAFAQEQAATKFASHGGTKDESESGGLFVRHIRFLVANERDAERLMQQCDTHESITAVNASIEYYDVGSREGDDAIVKESKETVVLVQLRQLSPREVVVSFDTKTELSLFATDGSEGEKARAWRLRLPLLQERCSH